MRPVSRGSVNKSRSVRQFRKNSARTKRANVNTSDARRYSVVMCRVFILLMLGSVRMVM